jgi:hypothetical protein
MKAGLLYAGTDDGRVWMTQNDGGAWTELTSRFPGVPAGTYVSRIEPSSFDVNRVYVTFDNHRRGDFTPYVFVSDNGGATFRSIANNLPKGGPNFVHVIREDVKNQNLLFVGTDIGAYVSGDRGATWQPFMTGLPNVPVHDLRIHPRDAELIAGTHGRSIWIVDIAPLQQMPAPMTQTAHLYAPRTAFQWGEPPSEGQSTGQLYFQVPSPQYGADIWYRLSKSVGPVRVVVMDAKGDTMQTLTGQGQAGVHKVTWGFNGRPAPRPALTGAALRDSVLQARRMAFVLDSVQAEGKIPAPAMEMLRRSLAQGATGMQAIARQFGFGGGGGGGGGGQAQPGRWVERPGESAPPPAPGQGGGRGGAGGPPGGAPGGQGGQGAGMGGVTQEDLFAILRATGMMGGGGGGGFGGGAPVAEPGTYVVAMTVEGQTYTQTLRVERMAGGGGSGFPFELEEMERAYNRWLRTQR